MPKSLRRSHTHARGTKRKRTIIIGLGAVAAVAGGVVAVPAAMAAREPAQDFPAFQLKEAESFDTDAMMATLCPGPTSTTPFKDVSFWFMNDETGEVGEDRLQGIGSADGFPDGHPIIHSFQGHCEYPASETKEFNGDPVRVGEEVPNCGDKVQTAESHSLRLSNSSQFTHSVSVGASLDFKIIKDVLGIGASVEVTNSWSFGQSVDKIRTRDIQVPPQTVGFLERVPKLRTVTSQPNFLIEKWEIIENKKIREVRGYKGKGLDTIRITSSGYTMSATADVLDSEGFPAGVIRADDRPVTAADCD